MFTHSHTHTAKTYEPPRAENENFCTQVKSFAPEGNRNEVRWQHRGKHGRACSVESLAAVSISYFFFFLHPSAAADYHPIQIPQHSSHAQMWGWKVGGGGGRSLASACFSEYFMPVVS